MTANPYYDSEDAFLALARAEDNPQSRALLGALRARQQELREKLEGSPRRSDDLRDDCVGMLGELRGVGFLLKLVHETHEIAARSEARWPS